MFLPPERYATPQKWLLDVGERLPGSSAYSALADFLGTSVERVSGYVAPFPPRPLPLMVLYSVHACLIRPGFDLVPLATLKALTPAQNAVADHFGVAHSWLSYALGGSGRIKRYRHAALTAHIALGIELPPLLRKWSEWGTDQYAALYRVDPDAYREIVGLPDAEVRGLDDPRTPRRELSYVPTVTREEERAAWRIGNPSLPFPGDEA